MSAYYYVLLVLIRIRLLLESQIQPLIYIYSVLLLDLNILRSNSNLYYSLLNYITIERFCISASYLII